jgi:hypothetical protein
MACYQSGSIPTPVEGVGDMFFGVVQGNLSFVQAGTNLLGMYRTAGNVRLGAIVFSNDDGKYSFSGFRPESGVQFELSGGYLKVISGTNQWTLKMVTARGMAGSYSPVLNGACVPSGMYVVPEVEGYPKVFGVASWSPSGEVVCQVDMTLVRKDERREYVYYSVVIRPVLCTEQTEELMQYALLRLFLGIFVFGKYDVCLLRREWFPTFLKRLKSGCYKKYAVFFENDTWTKFQK